MNLPARALFRSVLVLVASLMFSRAALTVEPEDALPQDSATNALILPALPKLRSPVDNFRKLLGMTLRERKLVLTNRPPEVQKLILAKLVEYEMLKPNERELRLRATELQWYLLPMLSVPRANRADRLALIPDEPRKLVEGRLAQWDLLPPTLQEEMLNNEMTARYFGQVTETNRDVVLSKIPADRRAKLEAGLDRWRGLSEEQRQRELDSFNAFFELTPREKEKALNTLSEAEQRQMEKTLASYEKLTIEQRKQCITSFEKFTGMSVEERQLFLKNARTWKSMSPAERDSWRKLVEFAPLQPPLPPRPSPPRRRAANATVATND